MSLSFQKIGVLTFIIVSLWTSQKSQAQCSGIITNLPDTIYACKNTPISLNPGVSTFGNAVLIDTVWHPGAGLSDSNIINPIINVGTTDLFYTLQVTSVAPVNLIPNGDFSAGNVGFTSDYGPGTGGTWGLLSNEAQYAISTNPVFTHTNFASFGDHTTGTGNMMVVNGSSVPNVNIWCQTINVNPNTWYDFSAWGATCVSSAPAILQFSINGNLTGTPLALPLATGVWSQFHTTWFSGANTSIVICITDQTAAASGNDFAIDDIAFKEICDIKDSVYVRVTNLTPSFIAEKHLGCKKDTVKFIPDFGIGDAPSSYVWHFGDGTISSDYSPTHVYQLQGVYDAKLVIYKNGCADSISQFIDLNHPIDAVFNTFTAIAPPNVPDNDSTCVGVKFDAFSLSVGLGITHEWNWGDGTINTYPFGIITDDHDYAAAGTYTLVLKVTDTLGCMDSAKINLFVDEEAFVSMDISDSVICIGSPVFLSDSVAAHAMSFDWNFGDGKILTDVHNPTHVFDQPKSYTISLTGKYAKCPPMTVSKTLIVESNPILNLGKDTSICPNLTKPIQLSNQLNSSSIMNWNTGENAQSISVLQPGTYWATEFSLLGKCKSTDTILVKRDCYLHIPNSFSPNGDGINDYFIPRDLAEQGITGFEIEIYNRWGEMIFASNRLMGNGWDGKYNGKEQPMGVYVYKIGVSYKNGKLEYFQGNVTLVR